MDQKRILCFFSEQNKQNIFLKKQKKTLCLFKNQIGKLTLLKKLMFNEKEIAFMIFQRQNDQLLQRSECDRHYCMKNCASSDMVALVCK